MIYQFKQYPGVKVFVQTLQNFHRFTSILNDASRLSRPVYETTYRQRLGYCYSLGGRYEWRQLVLTFHPRLRNMTYLPLLLSLHRSSPELLPLIQPLYLLTIRFPAAYTRATMGQGVRKRRLRVLSSRIDRKICIYQRLFSYLATVLPAPTPPTRQNNFHG